MSTHGRSDKEDGRDDDDGSTIISYEQLPLDLTMAIFWKLPAKYIARICCVSNLWSSIIITPGFVNHPSNQPSLLVCVRKKDESSVITALSQHHNPSTRSFESYHMKIPNGYGINAGPTRGLLCLSGLLCLKSYERRIGVWNPTIRQYVMLPKTKVWIHPIGILGYDPIEDKYKVLSIPTCSYKQGIEKEAEVLTLGDDHKESWRPANGCPFHRFTSGGPCINGVIYYEAHTSSGVDRTHLDKQVIIRFDVRFEKFQVMEIPHHETQIGCHLFNYQGRLAWVSCNLSSPLKLCILEDDGKQEWSCRDLLLPFPLEDPIWKYHQLIFIGVVDTTGELIFIADAHEKYNAFYILYYDPKSNHVRKISFEGAAYEELTRGSNGVNYLYFFPNHIENFMSLQKTISLI